MITITYTINIKWLITGYDNYGIGVDNQMYNLKNNRKIKQIYNNGSIGYKLSGKYISLKQLRILLYKPKKEKLPF